MTRNGFCSAVGKLTHNQRVQPFVMGHVHCIIAHFCGRSPTVGYTYAGCFGLTKKKPCGMLSRQIKNNAKVSLLEGRNFL